ncbi:MAG: tRNA (adenosine(37)-N6)-dimethylallyltransferase MiaA [Dehalococcoidia bacterium]|nr:MAG: tRNA (adenosine(37)-N6)-dimethylallyltransferase MiaA [Dehalococcoidia bacterium]
MNSLVAIVGPTAIGKSSLALDLCQTFRGEIINADSRQVYRYMDIGTAKPTMEERALVPHHLIDVVCPDQNFSLALYQGKAREAIHIIRSVGKLPLLVGGSGLYVWSLLEGWRIPPVAPDPILRQELEAIAQSKGTRRLYEELKQLDPAAAQRIDPRNTRRVIRALEVCRQGLPFSQLQGKEPFVNSLVIGLTTDRTDLYQRIDARVNSMMGKGLLTEVEGLLARGYTFDLPSMSGLGYKQMDMVLQGKTDLPTAIQQIKFDTHRFARHQYSWFRPQDKRIHWFDAREEEKQAINRLVQSFVANQDEGVLEN